MRFARLRIQSAMRRVSARVQGPKSGLELTFDRAPTSAELRDLRLTASGASRHAVRINLRRTAGKYVVRISGPNRDGLERIASALMEIREASQ